ncbi:exodeoxyribonuclease V subunit beta [Stenotrophomonas daejeonensis]|uniref:RecBCD enzyme subunit RecB n=1 Tax=Stenotrophomonas daejeonensis TaxID=659018 RepID=A0A0R0E7Q8_9GAMM|nr:exodeoxyribonuclease V subunit beta [Stenotrophomonas daejeonensis]KRG86561.1 exodeoxyribonuclease V subunit beta [Stenotrophomonas daejeonensis]
MNAAQPPQDPYLDLPLSGLRLIEASAGTGKTFTLATLFTRLVVEQGLRMGQILAVTFTDAATQELRKRIRERLDLAARLAEAEPAEGGDAETVLTRAILQRHLAQGGESTAQLARRLRIAAEETDLAVIFTIHGFCTRVLGEHALESGHGFATPELLTNTRPLHAELAADLWRLHAARGEALDALLGLWKNPEALAADLPALLADLPLLPEMPVGLPDDPRPLRDAAAQALRQAIEQHLPDARQAIADAFQKKVFDGRRAKQPSFEQAFAELINGGESGEWPRGKIKVNGKEKTLHIDKLAPDQLQGFCKEGQQAPASPLFDALQAWFDADDFRQQWLKQKRVELLHHLRFEARQRLAHHKQQYRVQTYDDLIDGVHAALAGAGGTELAARLRAQYRFALVDEFQDTDPRQWDIFRRVFAEPAEAAALFLIGDPKQAIYGFRGGDVHTYLHARALAEEAPRLAHNFRSRPAVLRAIDALYANAGEQAFLDPRIRFGKVEPGSKRNDADYLLDGAPAPALTLHLIAADAEGKPLKADDSRDAATLACVADIHRVLSAAREGKALIGGKPVQPGDIAVLVRSHKEAARIQQALAAVGIPAVAAGKHSLFATTEAHELRLLLLALLQPADEGRLRTALATVLLGESAAAIAALEHEGECQRRHQERLLQWRERWQRGGVLAMLSELCAEQAPRLLALTDGERRLSNYLQLGELLQEAGHRSIGLHGLLDWLQARIAHADAGDDTQLLRLESDARRVQVITLHKSKGLEYPLVYLPFVGIDGKAPDTDAHKTVHDGDRRVLHWKIDKDAESWKAATAQANAEEAAETARLLYVGLTRAEHALWMAAGAVAGLPASRLGPMLGDMDALAAHPDIRIVEGSIETLPARLPPEREQALPPVRNVQRALSHDWWVYSFTQLAHAEAGHDTAAAATEDSGGATDEPAQPEVETDAAAQPDTFDPRFAGSRFGNVLHAALENTDFAAWSGWQPGDAAPQGQGDIIAAALRKESYAETDIADGVALLTALVGQTLTVALPEGGALHALDEGERRAEIEFHFAMQPTAVPALLRVLHEHGVAGHRHGFGTRQRLEGLMTGKIDLTYVRDGRWYVLDYKSNRLPGYAPAQLEAAMRHSEYDLQALIYTVALHRWLRFRLGDGYDYARNFGGIRYLFCRGLDATRSPSPGLHAHRFTPELVQAVDELFAGGKPSKPLSLRERGWGEGQTESVGTEP